MQLLKRILFLCLVFIMACTTKSNAPTLPTTSPIIVFEDQRTDIEVLSVSAPFCDGDQFSYRSQVPWGKELVHRLNIFYVVSTEDSISANTTKHSKIQIQNTLDRKFDEANIKFHVEKVKEITSLGSIENIYDTFFYFGEHPQPYINEFRREYGSEKAFNLFFIPRNRNHTMGLANDIGGNTAIIQTNEEFHFSEGGRQYMYPHMNYEDWMNIVTHEIGHLFGLYHTHTTDINNYNSNTSGDFICDTPKCPQPVRAYMDEFGQLQSTELDSLDFEILKINTMSYSLTELMTEFTPVQQSLMRKNSIRDKIVNKTLITEL